MGTVRPAITVLVRGVICTSCTLLSRAIRARAQRSTPSVIENAATSDATPMITPVVERVVRIGLVRSESAPTLADSTSAAEFTLGRFTTLRLNRGLPPDARRISAGRDPSSIAEPERALQIEYGDRQM